MATWTDELKAEAVAMYLKAKPTPETSMDIVGDVGADLGFSPNSVRMILSKAGVYITKSAAAGKPKAATGGTRVSKEATHEALASAISAMGQEPDMEIISKLTGKASQYILTLLTK